MVLTDPSIKRLVREVSPGIFVMPAAFIVICAERSPGASEQNEWTYLADCAIAAQNFMLATHALGPASCVAISYAQTALEENVALLDDLTRTVPRELKERASMALQMSVDETQEGGQIAKMREQMKSERGRATHQLLRGGA